MLLLIFTKIYINYDIKRHSAIFCVTVLFGNAQIELSNGTVKTSSGRQWGVNATKATSPYYLPGMFENTEARTYWGSSN